jgi:hypothetical protein
VAVTGVISGDWIEHRRPADRELLGWIRPDGDEWVAVNLLGHAVSGPVDWIAAEAALDELGLGWLAEIWTLDTDDGPLRVRISHVGPGQLVVTTDDFGAIDIPVERIELAWPAPPELRPRS